MMNDLDVVAVGIEHVLGHQRLRGALAVYRGPNAAAELFSGTTLAQVTFDRPVARARGRYLALLHSLVQVGAHHRTGARLAPPRLPVAQARAVAQALAVRPHHRTLRAAARALGIAPVVLRGRLRLGHALRALRARRHASC